MHRFNLHGDGIFIDGASEMSSRLVSAPYIIALFDSLLSSDYMQPRPSYKHGS